MQYMNIFYLEFMLERNISHWFEDIIEKSREILERNPLLVVSEIYIERYDTEKLLLDNIFASC